MCLGSNGNFVLFIHQIEIILYSGEDKAKTLHFWVQAWNLAQLFFGMVKNFLAKIPKNSGP